MDNANDYMQDLQNEEIEQGLSKLRTLAFEFSLTIERLPSIKKEIDNMLKPRKGINYGDMVDRVEAQLEQAADFLTDVDTLPIAVMQQDEIKIFVQTACNTMTLRTAKKLQKKLSPALELAEKTAQKEQALKEKAMKKQQAELIKKQEEERKQQAELIKKQEEERKQQEAEATRQKKEQERKNRLFSLGYVDNDNGTITDQKTGLMWMKCTLGQSGQSCKQGNAKTFMRPEALKQAQLLNTSGGYAGYTDWYLPSITELTTLVRPNESPTICFDAFPNTLDAYWSSSPSKYSSNDQDYGIGVDFSDGITEDMDWDVCIRLVRRC
jgi:flagellar motor protein MotB